MFDWRTFAIGGQSFGEADLAEVHQLAK